MNNRVGKNRWAGWLAGAALLAAGARWAGAAPVCCEVKIEIQQEMTVERQAFDAMMRISNGFDALALSNVTIQVTFQDAQGNPVEATSSANLSSALFFARTNSLSGINSVNNGTVPAKTAAEIHWLIIPAVGAGGTNSAGKTYYVGATLSYTLRGTRETVTVFPDRISVRPMPRLTLDYYLPFQVYGDDPWTEQIEEVVPFGLGLRVQNTGAGPAKNLKVESMQPEIVENRNGLRVGFELLGCEVQGEARSKSLLADFGEVGAGKAKVARWQMTASMMGTFTNFTAGFTHADSLGGELTSLIAVTRAHRLIRDVRVEKAERDGVLDFLIQSGSGVAVHESDRLETLAVRNLSGAATLAPRGASAKAAPAPKSDGESTMYELTVPRTNMPLYVDLEFPEGADKKVGQVLREDGTELDEANAWISKRRESGEEPWEYHFHLFDTEGGGTYTVTFDTKAITGNEAPVLAFIGNQAVEEGKAIGFQVHATDPNGTTPAFLAVGLPVGAALEDHGTGWGTVTWQTQTGDYGVHPVKIIATDGEYTDWEIVKIYVGHPGEEINPNGVPLSLAAWKPTIFNVEAATSSGNATVEWECVEGIPYDVFRNDYPFDPPSWPAWVKTAQYQGRGGLAAIQDGTLGEANRRYYQVALYGDEPSPKDIWGVIRREMKPASFTMMAPPVRMDRRFDGEMGFDLAEELNGSDSGIGAGGAETYILKPDGSWRMLYLDAEGVWREADGMASTLELSPGQGFWVANKSGTRACSTFAGPVGNDGTQSIALKNGFNLIGPSEGKDLSLVDVLATANPHGGATEGEADQVALQKADGSWRILMFVANWGAPYDGHWFDLSTYQIVPTNEIIEPGAAFYYLRRGGDTTLHF